jgi:hypothetical protein
MSKPFGNMAKRKFYTQNAITAARKADRRRAGKVRPAKSGGAKHRMMKRGRWLREMPFQKTEKQGKNHGRAPRYTPALLPGDPGQRPGKG